MLPGIINSSWYWLWIRINYFTSHNIINPLIKDKKLGNDIKHEELRIKDSYRVKINKSV